MAERARDLLRMNAPMNKSRKVSPIGVAGGVLSLAGVCLGIVSLGKKTERSTSPVQPPTTPRPAGEQIVAESSEVSEAQCEFVEVAEALQSQALLSCVSQPCPADEDARTNTELPVAEEHEEQSRFSEESDSEQMKPEDPIREARPPQQAITDLARNGASPLAIAQMLGISVGEVELTLKLQQRISTSAGRLR